MYIFMSLPVSPLEAMPTMLVDETRSSTSLSASMVAGTKSYRAIDLKYERDNTGPNFPHYHDAVTSRASRRSLRIARYQELDSTTYKVHQ